MTQTSTHNREFKDTKDLLIQSQQRLQALFDHSLDAILLANDEGQYVEVNPAACHLTGYSREELLNLRVWDLTPQINLEQGRALWQVFLTAGKQSGEYTLKAKDGSLIEVEYRATAHITPGLHLSLLRDVTERKQAEKALRQSERRFQQITQSVDVVFYITDVPEQRVRYISPAFERLWGLAAAELLRDQTYWLKHIHPDDLLRTKEAHEAFLAGGPPYNVEYRICLADGTERWVRDRATAATRNAAGKISRITGIAEDITQRKQTEKQLREAQESLTIAIEAAQMGTWDLDLTRDFSAHRSLRHDQIFGYETAQTEWGQKIAKRHIVEEDRKIFDAAFARAAQTGVLDFEVRIRWADGSIHWMGARGRFYFDKNGQPVRGAGINFDITERKRQEEALRESEEHFRSVFESIDEGFCIAEMIFDEQDRPVDYRFLQINPVFAQLTGLENAIGRTARELVPGLEAFWFEIYGGVALTGEAVRFENGSEPMGRWFDVHASRIGGPDSRRIAIVFTNITKRKQTEKALRESEYRLRMASDAANIGIHDYDIRHNQITWDDKVRSIWGIEPGKAITYETFASGLHPDDLTSTQAALDQALDPLGDGKYQAEYRVIHRQDGRVRWVAATGQVFFEEGRGAVRLIGTAQDITERKRAEEGQQLLAEVSRLLTTSLNMADRLQTVAELLVEEFADWCALNLLTEEGTVHLSVAEHHVPEKTALIYEFAQAYPLAAKTSVTLKLIHNRQASLYHSFLDDLPAERAQDEGFRQFLDKLGGGSTIIVPLVAQEQTLGFITLVRAETSPSFDNVDLALSAELAYRTAIAMDNVRLYEAERAARLEAEAAQQSLVLLAEMRERNRMAQELHDTVAQALGYLNLKVGIALASLNQEQVETTRFSLQELKQVINETYTDVREEIFNLRAQTVSDLSFMELLHRYLDKYRRFYNLDVQLSQEAEAALFEFPIGVTPQVVRTIQEALINIRKHAGVNTALIRLGQENGQVCISIEDQGQGFDPEAIKGKTSNFGLKIMQERIESVGGSLEIKSALEQGTQVVLRFK